MKRMFHRRVSKENPFNEKDAKNVNSKFIEKHFDKNSESAL